MPVKTTNLLLEYLLFINCISFILYGIDKIKAKYKRWRISKKTLLILIFIGGSLGAIVGMYIFKHKTQKIMFKVYSYLGLITWICISLIFLSN